MRRSMMWTIGCVGLLAGCAAPPLEEDADSVEGAAKSGEASGAFQEGEYEAPGLMPPFDTGVFLRLATPGPRSQAFELRAGGYTCTGELVATSAGAESRQARGCKLTLSPRSATGAFDFDVEVDASASAEFSGVGGSFSRRDDGAYRRTFTGADARGRKLVASVVRLDRGSASAPGALTVTLTTDGARVLEGAALARTAAARFENADYALDLTFATSDQRRTRGLVVTDKKTGAAGLRLE